MGLSVGIFETVFRQSELNFGTIFGQFGLNFQECFQTVQVEFLRLFSNSLDGIFGTIFGQSETRLKFGFDPRNDVFGFCGVF